MAAEIINLNQVRKNRARAEKEKSASENRILFGRTKAEKDLTRARNEKAEKTLDQGKIDKSEDDN